MAERHADLSADLMALSEHAARDATTASQRGDSEGSLYARGLRDAYATAAMFVRTRQGVTGG